MSDVTTSDSAQKWRAALESIMTGEEFGRQIIMNQFFDMGMVISITSEEAIFTNNQGSILNAEIYIPLPMLNKENAWHYSDILIKDKIMYPGSFKEQWEGSTVAEECANETRQQLEEDIKAWRQIAAEMAVEMCRTDKLIA
jgi:hypothetical protein